MVGKVIDIDIIMIVKQKQFVIGDDAAGGWVPGSHHRIQRLQYKPDQNFFSACRKPAGNVKHTITNIWHYLNDVLYYKIQCYVCKFVTSMCYQNEEDHVFGKIKASRIHFLKLKKSSWTLKHCNPSNCLTCFGSSGPYSSCGILGKLWSWPATSCQPGKNKCFMSGSNQLSILFTILSTHCWFEFRLRMLLKEMNLTDMVQASSMLQGLPCPATTEPIHSSENWIWHTF